MALQGNSWSCSCENVWLGRWLRRWMREALQLHTSVVERGQTIRNKQIFCSQLNSILLSSWFLAIFHQQFIECCQQNIESRPQGRGEDHHLQQHRREREAPGGAGQ